MKKITKKNTFVIAVSGGVDSIVLLDKMSKLKNANIIVAHFEHGIRGEESKLDAEFVKKTAKKYGFKYEVCYGALGKNASEDLARTVRYEFLRQVAKEYDAILTTAHHADDVLESIAINISRGTGWRGLAVMNAKDIYRPLLNLTKADILNYVSENNLQWREDSTNLTDKYLRNRLRTKIKTLPTEQKKMLYELYVNQIFLSYAIDQELAKYVNKNAIYERYFFIMCPDEIGVEILRFIIKSHTNEPILHRQAEKLLLAIKTANKNDIFELNKNVIVKFGIDNFHIILN